MTILEVSAQQEVGYTIHAERVSIDDPRCVVTEEELYMSGKWDGYTKIVPDFTMTIWDMDLT